METNPRELLESKIDALREALLLHIGQERSLRETQNAATETALRLQRAETDRRLDALNHEAARLAVSHATYLPRETFAVWQEGFDRWKQEVLEAAAETRGQQMAQQKLWAAAVLVANMVITASVFWIMHR